MRAKQFITELKTLRFKTTYYVNPGKSMFLKLLKKHIEVRAFEVQKDLFVWNGYDEVHHNAMRELVDHGVLPDHQDYVSYDFFRPDDPNTMEYMEKQLKDGKIKKYKQWYYGQNGNNDELTPMMGRALGVIGVQ